VRRVIFYLFYDAQGVVDDYIPYKLQALRPYAEHIFVVSNSTLTVEGRAALEEVADTVWARENVGFDVWGYKQAMEMFGWDKLADYDELILMNYTCFAPIFPFAETFDVTDARDDIDFWGITIHKEIDPNPFPGSSGILPRHIQSHWIAVRKQMFTSLEFTQYWQNMPMITSYQDSILLHESKFTQHFAERGFRYMVTCDPDVYPSDHPVFESAVLMLRDRCPLLKRRIFFHEPTYLDRNAILGKRVMEEVEKSGYPVDLIWRNVVRSAEPRTLYTNMTLLTVLPDSEPDQPPGPAPRICVLAHIFYEEMTAEIMGYAANIPVPYDIVVTTTTDEKKASIEASLAELGLDRADVRVVESNRGRAESAFVVACRDVLLSGDYDLVLKLHSKKSPQNGYNLGSLFKHHTIDNLLSSAGYVGRILEMFDKQASLGMIFPPVVNIGFPTMGHSWFTNRLVAAEWAKKLDLHTVFDRTTPLAPYGTMFWARPDALRKMIEYPFRYEDFAPEKEGWNDGMLGHVLERLYGYTVMDAGYTAQCALNTDWAAINYAFLEYKLQRVSSMLPGYLQEQMDYLELVQSETPLHKIKSGIDEAYPKIGRMMRPGYRAARATVRGARNLRGRG
jgi:lipopolysaccharide biosynthesis protein